MDDSTSNDNDFPRTKSHLREPDPHGQAAMLLLESLIHGLIARSVITVENAIEIVDVAAEVKKEVAEELGDSPATMEASLAFLGAIRASLSNDPSRDGGCETDALPPLAGV
jgi:hypothetical protein